jgi:hypothetical protein
MKQTLKITLLALTLFSLQANAKMKFENAYLKVKDFKLAGADGRTGAGIEMLDTTAGVSQLALVNVDIVIKEFDKETFGSKVTVIPAHMRVRSVGPAIFGVEQSDDNIRLFNTAGKKISDLFGKYYGVKVSAGFFVGAGVDLRANSKSVLMEQGNGINLSSGVMARLISLELDPGDFTIGKTNVQVAQTTSVTNGSTTVQNVNLSELSDVQIGN